MGVPALFRWLSNKYPKIVSQVIEERPQTIAGQEVPVDITAKNPNGEEFDNLYLDMNGIVHPCSHPEDRPAPTTEEEMMQAIFKYTERVFNMVRPRKLLMIAVDGVAPRAKMNQQRSRRFRSAKEAKEKDEQKEEFMRLLRQQNGGVVREDVQEAAQQKTWDSNAITPGTPFMDILAASLRYWCKYKLNTDPGWKDVNVIISDATVPGEGEHKIMQFIRSQRFSPEHNPNTRHVIYGLDADLIMLGLATHEPYFRVLREDVFFQESKARTCHICGQKGHIAEACTGQAAVKQGEFDEKDGGVTEKPFIWLHVSVLREYLAEELFVVGQQHPFDLERALDDWVFMCFFVGNDFLPHLPSLDIRENGIDTLITIWKEQCQNMGSYLTRDGSVELSHAQRILDALAKQEDHIFRRRHQANQRREANNKRRRQEEEARANRLDEVVIQDPNAASRPKKPTMNTAPDDLPLFTPGARNPTREERAITQDLLANRSAVFKANEANKSAAAILKDKLKEGKKRKADAIEAPESPSAIQNGSSEDRNGASQENPVEKGEPEDEVRLWEDGYADRYYQQKFKVDPENIAFRNRVARDYVEGLAWVLLYYFQGCPSWTWYYPHHYAPFAADFVDIAEQQIVFEKGKPFRPFEQLMGVLPAASNHAIPEAFRPLMEEADSEIIDFYPPDFPIDLNGKKMAWQGVALLPFIDEKRLLDAMATKYPLISAEDQARNEPGREVLIISDQTKLYNEMAMKFYSKQQGEPRAELRTDTSNGLAGFIEKNEDYMPGRALEYPLGTGMPNLNEDHTISVNYDMLKCDQVHKSMLLRGVQVPLPILDDVDRQELRNKISQPGRGGFHGHRGRGGGRPRSYQSPGSFGTPHGFSSPSNFSSPGDYTPHEAAYRGSPLARGRGGSQRFHPYGRPFPGQPPPGYGHLPPPPLPGQPGFPAQFPGFPGQPQPGFGLPGQFGGLPFPIPPGFQFQPPSS